MEKSSKDKFEWRYHLVNPTQGEHQFKIFVKSADDHTSVTYDSQWPIRRKDEAGL